MIQQNFKGRTLSALAFHSFCYENNKGTSFSPSRSIVLQTILYEIYFKPDGVSFEDSGLLHIAYDKPFMGSWTLNDHFQANVQLCMGQRYLETFKAEILPMVSKRHSREHSHDPEFVIKQYHRIVDFYEATGFYENLPVF